MSAPNRRARGRRASAPTSRSAAAHNLALLRGLPALGRLGRPLLVGTSRKGFLTKVAGGEAGSARLFGTAATVAWAVTHGAAVVRVHDVGPIAQVVRTIRAIQAEGAPEY